MTCFPRPAGVSQFRGAWETFFRNDTVQQGPGVVRSDHATHSVAAFGPKAVELTVGHKTSGGRPGPWGPAAFGHGSPWEKFYEWNVRYVFFGVTMRVNTMRHFIQSRIVKDCLNRAGRSRPALEERVQGWCKPGVWPNYDDTKMEARLTDLGQKIRFAAIGAGTARLLQARDLVDHSRRILESEPDRWFDANFLAWYREIKSSSLSSS